ncbi:MAG TPA: YCF48-related protein [Ignavibacteriaceae bacterium]|nr:YCF48-related protein [Ignavibacteriaceae bacterium]
MKYLAFFSIIFFSLSSLAYPQESRLNKILGNGTIFFTDENNGWIFDEYHIRKTSDAGKSWEVMLTFETSKKAMYSSTIGTNLITFVNAATGYFITSKYSGISNNAYVYKTTNSGLSWLRYILSISNNANTPNSLSNLFFINEDNGWVVSDSKNLLRTTNGGVSWEQIFSGTLSIQKIHFVDAQNGWAFINNKLNKTTNGGANWNEILVPGSTYIYTISTIGNNTWVGGYNDGIYLSTDGGINWNKVSNTFPSGPQSWSNGYLTMFSATHGVSNGHITTDGGLTWTEKFNRYATYRDVSLLNIDNCWFYDSNGNLNKTVNFFNASEVVFHSTTNPLENHKFTSVKILGDNNVVASFNNGAILRSSDNGKTWKFIDELYGIHQIRDISFTNSSTGVAVGRNYDNPTNTAFISRTTDAGESWSIVYQLPGIPNIYDEDIYSVDYSNGTYYALSRSKLLRSANDGLTWSADSTDMSWGLHQIKFIGNTGFGISTYGSFKLYKSVNGGVGWNLVRDVFCGGLSFVSNNLVFASFSDSQLCKSTDGGITWSKSGWTPSWNFNRVFFKDSLTGIASGATFSFGEGTFVTDDGGNTWSKVSELYNIINGTDNGIDYVSKTNGYIATDDGLYTLKSFGIIDSVTSIDTENEFNPQDYLLYQNYPNPFNPSTTIKFDIPSNANESIVILKVFDLLGNEVATLLNEAKPSGSYSVDWDASKLSTGVYFYKLQTGSFVSIKKMVLIK